MTCKLLKQVHCEKYVPRLYQYQDAGGHPFLARATGSPPTPVTLSGAWKIALAAVDEVEVSGLYMGDCGPFRLQDLLDVHFCCDVHLDSVHSQAVFGIVSAASDTYTSMAGILFRVQVDGTVVVECRDGISVTQAAIATGVTLGTVPREFVFNFREGVVLADPRVGGSYGGRRAIQCSISDANGLLQPIAQGKIFDLGAMTDRVQLIAQIWKTSATDAAYLNFRGASVEWRWDTAS